MQNKSPGIGLKSHMLYLLLAGAVFAANSWLRAADFKGAAEVLKEAAQASPKPKEKSKDPFEQLREKLKAFETQGPNLPAAEAAKRWLALVDEFEKESAKAAGATIRGAGKERPFQLDDVMKALPPPP